VCIRVSPNKYLDPFNFTVSQEFLQFPSRGDPRNLRVDKQNKQLISSPTLLLATRSLHVKPGSTHISMFLARIHPRGLSFPAAEYRVYPGTLKPLIQPSRYHGSCNSATSIPLTPTVLVIIPEAAMLFCRLAWIKEMVLTIERPAPPLHSTSSPLPTWRPEV
jgi:hypothetical protein